MNSRYLTENEKNIVNFNVFGTSNTEIINAESIIKQKKRVPYGPRIGNNKKAKPKKEIKLF